MAGTTEAEDARAAALQLTETGYYPVEVKPEQTRIQFEFSLSRFFRIRAEDLIFFNRQLATLITVGVSLLDALQTLSHQTSSRPLRQALETIRREVEGGTSLSQAMAQHPRLFSIIYVRTIEAAEAGGFLGTALERLAALVEHEEETRRKIIAATRYPMMVVGALAIAFTIFVTVIVPKFLLLYNAFRTALPWPTRAVLGLSWLLQTYGPALLVLAVAAFFLFRAFIRTEGGRLRWDTFKLQVPIFGPLVLKLILSRTVQTLATLTAAGVPLLKGLEISGRGTGNACLTRVLEDVRKEVEQGSSLAEPLARSPIIPPLVSQVVAVGEKTGELDSLLGRISEHYDMETNYAIRNLATTLEPILLIVVAVLLFFLALAVFLPLWDMATLIRKA
ncbi:MAG: type II secretion system F family protein [Candidatus Methylomirabilales bacterium]